jgi:hypothetical protein
MEKKKMTINLNTSPDRIRKRPVRSGQTFIDRKKQANKMNCRKFSSKKSY